MPRVKNNNKYAEKKTIKINSSSLLHQRECKKLMKPRHLEIYSNNTCDYNFFMRIKLSNHL